MIKLKQLLFELSNAAKNKIKGKWTLENPQLTGGQMDYYIKTFERFSSKPVFPYRDIFQYKFEDLEKIVDANFSKDKLEPNFKGEFDLQSVDTYNNDLIYEGDNLVILLADLREKCIKYGKGHKWCISRDDSSNMFNSYRYAMNERIFYFVFDKDKSKADPSHALVILVDTHNQYFVADAENSKNTGSGAVDWNYITKLQPKLKDLKDLFNPIPLSDKQKEEYELLKRIQNLQDEDAYIRLNYDMKEKYISVMYADLKDKGYANTPEDLKNKYIQIGHELSIEQYKNSSPALKNAFRKVIEKQDNYKGLKPALKRYMEKENPVEFLKMVLKGLNTKPFLKSQLKFALKLDPRLLQKAESLLTTNRNEVIRNLPEPTRLKWKYAKIVNGLFDLYRKRPEKVKEIFKRKVDSRNRMGNWYLYVGLKTFPDYIETYMTRRYAAESDIKLSPYGIDYADRAQLMLRTNINKIKNLK